MVKRQNFAGFKRWSGKKLPFIMDLFGDFAVFGKGILTTRPDAVAFRLTGRCSRDKKAPQPGGDGLQGIR